VRPRALAAATNPTRRTHPQRCRRRRTATLASGISGKECETSVIEPCRPNYRTLELGR
jgi:hypothetical protein